MILKKTCSQPTGGSMHWSTCKLASGREGQLIVARVWARAGLQPHRLGG
jgi:hypothetical protein